MANAKKIVIKINRSGREQSNMPRNSAPSEIVIWNVRRIVFAIIIAILFIVIPYFYLSNGLENKKERKTDQASFEGIEKEVSLAEKKDQSTTDNDRRNIEVISELTKKVSIDQRFKTISHYKVTRGLLTNAIVDKEPVKELVPPFVIGEKKSIQLYYFTELRDMKGESFFHQWIRDGVVIGKMSIDPQGNRWRVSSNRVLTYSDVGHWMVQLIDKNGLIYNEIIFEVMIN
ncbi:MAG: hypothetical protein CVV06_11485 [Gammaproteobacteria bacterium HGW-Gammaproteobacteria-10]|nr:MAG: hypothetical protein CVV06_11485 [Gammaproteobacteria bacterium HGW-Gammaproteobacteria-10]HBA66143.1 hypothetical protein [Methylococcaceae bacterium]